MNLILIQPRKTGSSSVTDALGLKDAFKKHARAIDLYASVPSEVWEGSKVLCTIRDPLSVFASDWRFNRHLKRNWNKSDTIRLLAEECDLSTYIRARPTRAFEALRDWDGELCRLAPEGIYARQAGFIKVDHWIRTECLARDMKAAGFEVELPHRNRTGSSPQVDEHARRLVQSLYGEVYGLLESLSERCAA